MLLWEWRTTVISLLTQKLSPGEAEADGEEYQRTLDNQGEAETYLQSYSALLADRRQALMNERTLLAAHDQREKKFRHTKAAIKAAAAVDHELGVLDIIDLQPEHEVLHLKLSAQRKALLGRLGSRAVRSVRLASCLFIWKETYYLALGFI
jgi:E3 ubiquitin-protein ligase SHPRH